MIGNPEVAVHIPRLFGDVAGKQVTGFNEFGIVFAPGTVAVASPVAESAY